MSNDFPQKKTNLLTGPHKIFRTSQNTFSQESEIFCFCKMNEMTKQEHADGSSCFPVKHIAQTPAELYPVPSTQTVGTADGSRE